VPIEEETAEGEIEVKTPDIVHYEIKHANVSMQFWLLLVYLVLFFAGACAL
jgi:hypothetical protein